MEACEKLIEMFANFETRFVTSIVKFFVSNAFLSVNWNPTSVQSAAESFQNFIMEK